MKSHRVFFAPVLAAALVVAAWMAPVNAATQFPNPIDGSPADGVKCRAGYTGVLSGNLFLCSKPGTIQVEGECLDPTRSEYIVRSLINAPNDVCVNKSNKDLGPTDPIGGIKNVPPTASTSKITTKVGNKQHDEAVALGLGDKEVEVTTGSPTLNANGAGKDTFDVPLTFFTRPIANGLLSTPFPLAK